MIKSREVRSGIFSKTRRNEKLIQNFDYVISRKIYGGEWILLAQGRVQWRDLDGIVMKLWLS
jgi:hypothetical protein